MDQIGEWGFHNNPQYDLILEKETSMMVILRSFGRAEINFHLVPIEDHQEGKVYVIFRR